MSRSVVITGIGMVTPLGDGPGDILAQIRAGTSAAAPPSTFDASPFFCPYCAEIPDFAPQRIFPENKTLRMMNRDALLAIVAARRAMEDAGLVVGTPYSGEDIGLFGSTGMAGMPLDDIHKLVDNAAGDDGELDLHRFGREALKRVRPVLSFKILANMPICFVSIFEGIRGPNAVYTPWEGQGARAMEAGILAVQSGRAKVAMVGGCDTKANLLGFIALQQHGLFDTWRETGTGSLPGEGATFLVLEEESQAIARDAPIHARIADFSVRTKDAQRSGGQLGDIMKSLVSPCPEVIMGSADGVAGEQERERQLIQQVAGPGVEILFPKPQVGNLFAAAAAAQVALAATACATGACNTSLANCIGHGSEMGLFRLEAV